MTKTTTPPSTRSRILLLEPLWLLALGPAILLPGSFVPMAAYPFCIAALFLFWPLRWFVRQTSLSSGPNGIADRFVFPPQAPFSIGILLLLLWLPVNFWASAEPDVSWIAIGYLVYGVALCVSMINWRPVRCRPEFLAYVLVAFGVALALVAPFLVQLKPEFRLFDLPIYDFVQQLSASRSETIHSNVLASALVQIAPLALALALAPISGRQRWAAAVATAILLAILILSQGRNALLATGIAMALMAVLYRPKVLWLTPLVVLGIVLLFYRMGPTQLLDLLTTNEGVFGGGAGRLDVWANTLLAIQDFAFTGIGVGTFTTVLPLLYPLQVSIEEYPHAHNLFLQVALDLGLPGFIAYLSILINVFAILFGSVRRRQESLYWALSVGLLASMTAMMVDGIFTTANWGTKLAFLPWLLFALAVLLYRQTMQENAQDA